MDASKPEIIFRKANCFNCGGTRNCDVRGHHADTYSDEHMYGWTNWYILQCRGCEHVFVQTVSGESEDVDYEYVPDGSGDFITIPNENVRYWPAQLKRKRPEWMLEFGIDAENTGTLDNAMFELYLALDNDLKVLAAIGIRTAYDIASELLGVPNKLGFTQKVNALVAGRHIGPYDRERLITMVDAGSASAHRGWKPTQSDLNTMMDVLEHFIGEAFVVPARRKRLDAEAAKVKKTVPSRSARVRENRGEQTIVVEPP